MDEATLESEHRELDARLETMRARGFEDHDDLMAYGDLLAQVVQLEERLSKSEAPGGLVER